MKELFKVKTYSAIGCTEKEVFFNNIMNAARFWVENAEKWSRVNPTIWVWCESVGEYRRLSDVNYFGSIWSGEMAEYLTRVFLYDSPENVTLLEMFRQQYQEYNKAHGLDMYKDIQEACAIYKMADQNRQYSYHDTVTGASITGTLSECQTFITNHDTAHNDKTSWGPVDTNDVEAWSMLEYLYK